MRRPIPSFPCRVGVAEVGYSSTELDLKADISRRSSGGDDCGKVLGCQCIEAHGVGDGRVRGQAVRAQRARVLGERVADGADVLQPASPCDRVGDRRGVGRRVEAGRFALEHDAAGGAGDPGKRSSMSSTACCDSAPGRSKESTGSPPHALCTARIVAATATQIKRILHGRRAATDPIRKSMLPMWTTFRFRSASVAAMVRRQLVHRFGRGRGRAALGVVGVGSSAEQRPADE